MQPPLTRSTRSRRRHARGLEPILCVLVVLCASAAVVTEIPHVMHKARATEIMLMASQFRAEAVLAQAEDGGFGLLAALSDGGVSSSRAAATDLALALPEAASPRTEQNAEVRAVGGTSKLDKLVQTAERLAEQRSLELRAEWDGQRGVVTGKPPWDPQPLRLSFAPAVPADGVPATLRMLCGNRMPPAGWFAVRDTQPQHVAPALLFSQCRATGQR